MVDFGEFPMKDVNTQNRWFAECQRNNKPCVYVAVERKLTTIYWDCITLDREDDCSIIDEEDDVCDEISAVLERYAGPKQDRFGGAFSGFCRNVSVENGRLAASEIFDILFSRLSMEQEA